MSRKCEMCDGYLSTMMDSYGLQGRERSLACACSRTSGKVEAKIRVALAKAIFNGESTSFDVEETKEINKMFLEFSASNAARDELVDGINRAILFIRNGIELDFITMPDLGTPDPAHDTLPLLELLASKHSPSESNT